MLARLIFDGSPTTNGDYRDVYDGVIGVITGGITATNNLPPIYNSEASSIDSNYEAPGWSIFDNDANNDASHYDNVLAAPLSDGFSGNKFVRIWLNGSTIYYRPYRIWDATTHSGLPFGVKITSPVLGEWRQRLISCNSSYLFCGAKSSQTSWDESYYNTAFFSEYTPRQPWNVDTAGYPIWAQLNLNGIYYRDSETDAYLPRVRDSSGTDIFNANVELGSNCADVIRSVPSGYTKDANGVDVIPINPLLIWSNSLGGIVGNITAATDIWCPNRDIGLTVFREETYAGNAYIAFQLNYNNFLFFRKG